MHRINFDSNLHSLYQPPIDPKHAHPLSHHYQQVPAPSSTMGPPECLSTPAPQTVLNGQSVQLAQNPRSYSPIVNQQGSSSTAENEIIDVETYEPTPLLIPEIPIPAVEQRTFQTQDLLAQKSYQRYNLSSLRDQFKLATFTCKFTNTNGQQCGQTFPIVLSYLSRYQENSLFRENFDSISHDFKYLFYNDR